MHPHQPPTKCDRFLDGIVSFFYYGVTGVACYVTVDHLAEIINQLLNEKGEYSKANLALDITVPLACIAAVYLHHLRTHKDAHHQTEQFLEAREARLQDAIIPLLPQQQETFPKYKRVAAWFGEKAPLAGEGILFSSVLLNQVIRKIFDELEKEEVELHISNPEVLVPTLITTLLAIYANISHNQYVNFKHRELLASCSHVERGVITHARHLDAEAQRQQRTIRDLAQTNSELRAEIQRLQPPPPEVRVAVIDDDSDDDIAPQPARGGMCRIM